ncbi:MAG TPA: XRE family transcriptional regulator [Candidatus Dormibacteraeota bacterium]|nr:XRE family transcriptional regulator [Candidatus Dormibacteraeota bacterium]
MNGSLGERIRSLRETRSLSLKQLADATGLTQSFLSQVERDLTSPSVASLRKIAQALGTSVATFFAGGSPNGRLVKRDARPVLLHPKRRWRDSLLTPSMTSKLQVIWSEIEPGGGSGDEPYSHDSDEECVVIVQGRLDFWVGEEHYLLEKGDALTFESRLPHKNRNPGPGKTQVLWVMTPPSY